MLVTNSVHSGRCTGQLPTALKLLPLLSQPIAQLADPAGINPNCRATAPVVSPNDSAFAIRRFRFVSVRSQAAKSKRAAAVSAGPARRSSTSCSFQTPS